MKIVGSGVYFLYDGDELVYIGSSNNIFYRIGTHIAKKEKCFDRCEWYETDDYLRLENFLIAQFRPKYNETLGHSELRAPYGMFALMGIDKAIKAFENREGLMTYDEFCEMFSKRKADRIMDWFKACKVPVVCIDGYHPPFLSRDYIIRNQKWLAEM